MLRKLPNFGKIEDFYLSESFSRARQTVTAVLNT
jgi:hypothetical protein